MPSVRSYALFSIPTARCPRLLSGTLFVVAPRHSCLTSGTSGTSGNLEKGRCPPSGKRDPSGNQRENVVAELGKHDE